MFKQLLVAFTFVGVAALAPSPAFSQSQFSRVRAASDDAKQALIRAATRSPTASALLQRLEQSDVIVYVVTAWSLRHGVIGALHFVTHAGGQRYLRISLAATLTGDDAVAVLAHELTHAVEVATAPEVVDQRTFEELYRTIGDSSSTGVDARYDTRAARESGTVVVRELRRTIVRASH